MSNRISVGSRSIAEVLSQGAASAISLGSRFFMRRDEQLKMGLELEGGVLARR